MRAERVFVGLGLAAAGLGACGGDSGTGLGGGGDITVAVDPAVIRMAPGATATVGITLQRINFDGFVTLSVAGAPDEIHVSTASVGSGSESTFTLTAGESAPEATHTLTVTAQGTGTSAATAILELTIGPDLTPSEFQAASIAAGQDYTCAIGTDAASYCWGRGAEFQLGTGTGTDEPFPTLVAGNLAFVVLSAGYEVSCGITAAGTAHCWGDNLRGKLGDGTTLNRLVPSPVAGGLTFSYVRNQPSTSPATCGRTTTGHVYCWGEARRLAGLALDPTSAVPILVAGGAEFTEIDVGHDFGCGIDVDGKAWCWGLPIPLSAIGNAGLPRGDPFVPTAVQGGRSYVDLALGSSHGCALTVEGQAFCWGWNLSGQIGDGTLTDKQVPVPVETEFTFESIYAGGPTTCALTEEGQAYCWGGGAMIVNRTLPRPVGIGLTFEQLSVGESHACGVTTDGSAYCWGRNFNGELGDGNGGASVIARVPVAVGRAP